MKRKKMLALFTAAAMTVTMNVSAAEFTAAVTQLNVDNGAVSMSVNKTSDESAKAVIASYGADGKLKSVIISDEISGTGDKTPHFGDTLDTSGASSVKAYVWKTSNGKLTLEPISAVYPLQSFIPTTPAPTADATSAPTVVPTATDAAVTEGYKATFVRDEHVKILVSDTQSFDQTTENPEYVYARSGDNGDITTTDGQVNFKVIPDDGYTATVTVSPKNYKNLKQDPEATGDENIYRITKITGDITITVTAQQTQTDGEATPAPTTDTGSETSNATPAPTTDAAVTEGYKATFVRGEHVKILVSDTQSFEQTTENPEYVYARSGDMGEITTTDGQVNFKVIPDDGYTATVTVEPKNYKNLKQDPEATGDENIYRITKITGDITITVTAQQTQTDSNATPAPTTDTGSETSNATPSPTTGTGSETSNATPSPTTDTGSENGNTSTEYSNTIVLNGDSVTSYADPAKVTVSGTSVTILSAGTYDISGTLTDGQINVAGGAKSDKFTINLNGVNVTSSSGNAFNATEGKVTLVPQEGTTSTFKSTSSSDDTTGISSKRDLDIKGEGTLYAISENGNGIRCKADLTIGVCDLYVTAANNGIKGDDSVTVTSKNKSVTVVSGGDGIKSDLEPTAVDTDGNAEGGTVEIKGGNINITANTTTDSDGTVSNGDGIQADSLLTISGGKINITAAGEALKANASSIEYLEDSTATQTLADGDGAIVITGGEVTASAGEDGIKAVKSVTISGGSVKITKAEDGIQVNEVIYDTDGETIKYYVAGEIDITGGTLDITSSEDGITCGTGNIIISDGNITVNSVRDCIQSYDTLVVKNGTFNLKANGGSPATVQSSGDGNATATVSYSCKGLKAVNLIYISGGTIVIDTYDDAIHSNDTVRICGGDIDIETGDDGVHGNSYLFISGDADINITKCYEGIEAAKLYVNGGTTRVSATDDGANAAGTAEPTTDPLEWTEASTSSVELFAGMGGNSGGGMGGNQNNFGGGWSSPNQGGDNNSSYGYLEINGGYLYVTTTSGDGLDANGNIVINGGIAIVDGATSSSEDGLDFDDGVEFNGGYVFTMTQGGMDGISGTYTQKYLLYGFSSSSSQGGMGGMGGMGGSSSSSSTLSTGSYAIVDSSDNVLCAFTRSKGSVQRVVFSSPDVSSSETYYIEPLTATGVTATDSLLGTIDSETYKFTISDGCTLSGTKDYSMTKN